MGSFGRGRLKVLAVVALWWTSAANAGTSSHDLNAIAQDGLWSCETYDGTTTYLSSVFRATATREAVSNAFAQVLTQKYGFAGRVDCPRANPDQTAAAKLQSDQTSRIAQLRGVGRTVVETGWAFGAANSVPYFCYGSVFVVEAGRSIPLFYMTDAFRVSGADRLTVVQSWEGHLRGVHPGFAPSSADCALVPPDDGTAKAQRQNAIAQHHVDGMQVVTEAWAYTGQTPAIDNRTAYFCEAVSTPQKTIYLSRIEVAGAGFDHVAASHAWGKYVMSTPGLGQAYAQAACESGPMADEQRVRAGRIEQQHSLAGGVVHEIDWTYGAGGGAATTAASAAATGTAGAPAGSPTAVVAPNASPTVSTTPTNTAPAPTVAMVPPPPVPSTPAPVSNPPHVAAPSTSPQTSPAPHPNAANSPPANARAKNPWVCQADAYAGDGRTHYISGPIQSDETQQQLVPAWKAHLVAAYRLPGQVVAHCGRLPKQSEDAIEAALAKNQQVPLVHDAWQP